MIKSLNDSMKKFSYDLVPQRKTAAGNTQGEARPDRGPLGEVRQVQANPLEKGP
jgi:hypothetical protein